MPISALSRNFADYYDKFLQATVIRKVDHDYLSKTKNSDDQRLLVHCRRWKLSLFREWNRDKKFKTTALNSEEQCITKAEFRAIRNVQYNLRYWYVGKRNKIYGKWVQTGKFEIIYYICLHNHHSLNTFLDDCYEDMHKLLIFLHRRFHISHP